MIDGLTLDVVREISIAVVAVLGIIVFLLDSSLKRQITRQHHAEEKNHREEKFAYEKSVAAELERQTTSQAARFDSMVSRVASHLKDYLVEDTSWLSRALGKNEFHIYRNTLFGDRSEHFKQEKDHIARSFCDLLIDHIKDRLENHDRVILVIDSGSTLYPIFRSLSDAAIEQRGHDPRPNWIEKLEVVTNNVPGALSLMESDRPVRNDGLAGLPLHCTLVAGQPLTEYGAITGPDANRSLKNILIERKNTFGRCYVISLVTGNWVRIRKSEPICPVPLARGVGHLSFKQVAMHHADETFVIAPLGKVFLKTELADINKLLRLEPSHSELKKRAYEEVDTGKDDIQIDESKIRLVTTLRVSKKQILNTHSTVLSALYGVSDISNLYDKRIADKADGEPLFIPFDQLVTDEHEQRSLEFPHSSTRNPEFMNLFHVKDD